MNFSETEQKLKALEGNVSLYYKNLVTGDEYGYREDEEHIAASVIKLTLMAAVFDMFEKGELNRDELIIIDHDRCVPSCGVLYYMKGDIKVSIRDLVELMIIVSDNTACNLLFDMVGEDRINGFIKNVLQLEHTSFNRKMFDSKKAALGIENYITAKDAGKLLEMIYRKTLVSESASGEMYQMLLDQRLNGKIPFILHTLPEKVPIAHKTGEDTRTTHDAAIIEGAHPFVLTFFGNETDVPAFERFMAETAAEIYAEGNV